MKCPYCIKVCNKCKRILVAYSGNFSKNKNGKYELYSKCKKCKKQYYQNNKEHYAEYHQNNKEHIAEYMKQYYEDNKEYYAEQKKQYYQDNKDKILEQIKQYRKNNPHIAFNSCNKRRSRLENQGNGITKNQWLEMMNYFNWCCAYSGLEFSSHNKENDRTIDHIIPLDKNGLNEIWNCVPMYRNYNTSKKASNMLDWYKQQDFYSDERLNRIYEWVEYAYSKWGV